MPITSALLFRDVDGYSAVVKWLEELRFTDAAACAKCVAAVHRPELFGYELPRPAADMLRDGIYELRTRKDRVQYRLIYFFSGRNVAVLVHSLKQQSVVPAAEIDRAIRRRRAFMNRPEQHTYAE